jgi:tetratricopeptide (TPR) repeat protein
MSETSQSNPDTPMPRWKRALFLCITISLPLALLLALEVGLRVAGWGGYPDFIRRVGALPSGETLCLVEHGSFKPYFFANPTRPGYSESSTFVMPKPAGTVRVFLIGESAAKGYPQPPNLAMSAFMQAMLSDAWPGRRVEVINLGTTAVASFPLIYQVRQALEFDPDLFVFYVGNNEFFGAYGTASINASGGSPAWMLPLLRAARGLALVQAFDELTYRGNDQSRTLMEEMIGQTFIPQDSPLRKTAATNLATHLGRMLSDVKGAKVQAIVCTTASNEAGMGPLGEDDVRGLSEDQKAEFDRLMKAAADRVAAGPVPIAPPSEAKGAQQGAIETLQKAIQLAPRSALARFRLGQAHAAAGDWTAAREAFLDARDLDTMPWRPTRGTEQAIQDAAKAHGAVLCDVAERFRARASGDASGWELMDDHVHPSLLGQAEVARAVLGCMSALPEPLTVPESAIASLPDDATYASRLGTNAWDDFRVRHNMRTLLGVTFMKRNNAERCAAVEAACRSFEESQSAAMRAAMDEWKTARPHAGGLRPLTGMVARVHLREKRVADALPLYDIARTQVPQYTSWYLEYLYFSLVCREVLNGTLQEREREQAAEGIAQAKFLLARGSSESGLTERYAGRLHQLRGEWAAAIPYLLAARPRMNAEDLVACDQALFMSYVRTGNVAAARMLADDGARNAGRFAPMYQQMASQLPPR